MKEVYVSLPTARQVQRFVAALTPLDGDFELVHGRHVLDARSLMGIFSLDLTRPILLKVYNDSDGNMEAIQPYIANTEGVARNG